MRGVIHNAHVPANSVSPDMFYRGGQHRAAQL